jgi:very-short-patch-repair endonuclease
MSRKNTVELTASRYAEIQARNKSARTTNERIVKTMRRADFGLAIHAPTPKPPKPRKSKPSKASKRSTGEEILRLQLIDEGLTDWQPEYRFDPSRRWRADFAFCNARLIAEVEGGHWSGGRHTRGAGFEKDCEKYNAATQQNWALLRFTTKMVKDGTALASIKQFLAAK